MDVAIDVVIADQRVHYDAAYGLWQPTTADNSGSADACIKLSAVKVKTLPEDKRGSGAVPPGVNFQPPYGVLKQTSMVDADSDNCGELVGPGRSRLKMKKVKLQCHDGEIIAPRMCLLWSNVSTTVCKRPPQVCCMSKSRSP